MTAEGMGWSQACEPAPGVWYIGVGRTGLENTTHRGGYPERVPGFSAGRLMSRQAAGFSPLAQRQQLPFPLGRVVQARERTEVRAW